MSDTAFRYWLAVTRAHEKVTCPEWWEAFCIACADFGMTPQSVRKLKDSVLIPGSPTDWMLSHGGDDHVMSYTWLNALKITTDLTVDRLLKLELDEYAAELMKTVKDLDAGASSREVEREQSKLYASGFGFAAQGCSVEASALECLGSLLAARFDTSDVMFLQGAYEYAQANKEAADALGRGDGDSIYAKNWRLFAEMAVDQVVRADGYYDGI